jgi:hypothetical protein
MVYAQAVVGCVCFVFASLANDEKNSRKKKSMKIHENRITHTHIAFRKRIKFGRQEDKRKDNDAYNSLVGAPVHQTTCGAFPRLRKHIIV